jgi:hypothetical protein
MHGGVFSNSKNHPNGPNYVMDCVYIYKENNKKKGIKIYILKMFTISDFGAFYINCVKFADRNYRIDVR